MWWLYELINFDGSLYRYAYSTESKDLDGIIEHDIRSGETSLIRACAADQDYEKAKARALYKFNWVIKEEFPAHKMVACG